MFVKNLALKVDVLNQWSPTQPTCPCRALEGKMWAMRARAGKSKP